jgi:hypothetical protein
MMLARRFRKVAMVALAGLALAVVSVPEAMAQGGGGGRGGGGMFGGMFGGGAQMYEPSVSSRDLDSFAQLFGLDASQKDAAKMLFDAYQQQFTGAAKKVREEQDAIREELRESRDPELFAEMREKTAAWQKSRNEMEKSFLGDFKAVLTDDQATKWPKFERVRRRETTVSRGLMSGERVDLFKLVDEMKLPAEQRKTLDPVLDQYEMDLDRELIERNKMQDEIQEKVRDLFSDPEKADEWIKKGREAAVKVRDVNRKYASQLETQLPAEKREAFDTAFRKESFPQIYRDSYYTRVVEAAGKLTDLDDNQKSGIAAIRDQYFRDLQTMQRDMEKAQEESEMNFSVANMMGGRRQGGGGNTNNNGGNNNNARQGGGGMFGEGGAMGELRTKRRELETGAVDKVKALLNEKQVEKLPVRGNDDQERGGRGRDGANTDDQPRRRGAGGDGAAPTRRPGRDE